MLIGEPRSYYAGSLEELLRHIVEAMNAVRNGDIAAAEFVLPVGNKEVKEWYHQGKSVVARLRSPDGRLLALYSRGKFNKYLDEGKAPIIILTNKQAPRNRTKTK